jgi:hypothetical protein
MPTAHKKRESERARRLPEVEMGEAGMTLIRTLTTVMFDV